MTKAEILAASEFWSVGPGKAVMEKWPVRWCIAEGSYGGGDTTNSVRHDEFGWWEECEWDTGTPSEDSYLSEVAAVHTIHGHYLDMLSAHCTVNVVLRTGFVTIRLAWSDNRRTICAPTLHEALAAAMEAAFGEPKP